jgi:hypothetical protein
VQRCTTWCRGDADAEIVQMQRCRDTEVQRCWVLSVSGCRGSGFRAEDSRRGGEEVVLEV